MSNAKAKEPTILPKQDPLPLLVEHLAMSTRKDKIHLLRFYVSLPEGWAPQAQLLVANESLKRMLDLLCQQCNYWPTTPNEE